MRVDRRAGHILGATESPDRCPGRQLIAHRFQSGGHHLDGKGPGAMAFTRIDGASAWARCRVSWCRAAFDDE